MAARFAKESAVRLWVCTQVSKKTEGDRVRICVMVLYCMTDGGTPRRPATVNTYVELLIIATRYLIIGLDRIVSGLWEFLAGAYHYFLLPVTSQMQAMRGILYGRRMRTVISVGIQWNYITVTTTTTSECDGMPGMLY